ncbi:MAG: carbohydrate ABC transporter permease [Acidimicrobiales bacterium]
MTTVVQKSAATPGAAPPSRQRWRGFGPSRWTLVVVIAGAVLIALSPVYWMVVTSFRTPFGATSLTPSYVPHHLTTGNYIDLVTGAVPFKTFLVNSIVTSVVASVVAVAISALAGYSFSRSRWKLKGPVSLAVLATQMLPLVVFIAPLYLLLLDFHLLNTDLGLVIGYTSFAVPFGAWLMKGFFDAVPSEIEEAARVDGYGRLSTLIRVVLPMTIPGLVTTGVFVFINSWNNLLYPLTLITSNSRQTIPPGLLDSFTGQFKTDWGGMMAAAMITTIPLVVAFFAVQRSMVKGMTAGALAGT